MKRSKCYKSMGISLEKRFQELTEKIKKRERNRLDVYTFIDILNYLEDNLKSDFELIGDIRSQLTWQEEVSLLCESLDNSGLFSNTLKDWISLRKIEGPDCYSAVAHHLVKQSQMQNSLSYIAYIQTNGLLHAPFDNWEDRLSFNHTLLNGYNNLFSACFDVPSFFFTLRNREKKQHKKSSITKSVEDTIKDYQNAVKNFAGMAILIEQAVLIQVCRAGSIVLNALIVGETKKIKEAKSHLEILRNFLLYEGKTMKNPATITELTRDVPGFCQVLFSIKEELGRESKHKENLTEVHSGQRLAISLPHNLSYYFNQYNKPQFVQDRLNIFKGGDFNQIIVSLLPNSLKDIHAQVRESTVVNLLYDYINLCDNLRRQKFDFSSAKKSFVDYAISFYNIPRKTAHKIYNFLDGMLEADDWASTVVIADIVLTTCLRGSMVEWDYLRTIVEHRLISKIIDRFKKDT